MLFRIPIVVWCLLAAVPAFGQHFVAQPDYGESNGNFPNWQERAVAELTNRARVDPATELAGCPSGQCLEAACYAPIAPLVWNYDLNQSSRFEATSMGKFPFWGHDTPCVLFSDINARFPGSSDGSFASSCSTSGTTAAQSRVTMFGAGFAGENIAAGYGTPHATFYGWIYETASTSACGFTMYNGHRYNILRSGPALGVGYAQVPGSPYDTYWAQDFGGSGPIPKIPSGSHWTAAGHVRDATAGDNNVEFWANWYDAAGAPTTATVVLDNVSTAMTRRRGTATNGAYSVTVSGVSAGCHTYYFAFADAAHAAVRYPTTGLLGFGAGCADFQDGSPPPSAPTGVRATATTSTQVQVTWNAVPGATSYQVYRRDPGTASYVSRGTTTTTSYNDAASASSAYLYRVRALNGGGSSADSSADLATTVMFTDDALVRGMAVKAAHLAELRTAVDAVRRQGGLSPGSYTDAAISGIRVKTIHVTQLRSYLDEAMSALGLATGGWTDTSLSGIAMYPVHLQEIRNRVK